MGDDIDPRRSGVRDYCPYKRAPQRNRGSSAVSDARLEGGIAYEVALVTLVAKTPQLAGLISIFKKILGEVADVRERIKMVGKGVSFVPMQKDHRKVTSGTQ